MRFKPVISLHGSGESVVLSNGAHADFTLMQGASGLGVRPQDISSVALPSGGSLVSHRRGTEAVVQLPILLGGTPRKRWDLRRKLERLCAGEVEVRVSRPNGVYRSRFGFYQAGLDGEYGAGEDSPDGQKIVLEIFSPDGLWKGEEQSPEFRLAGLRKRFLSDPAKPVPTGRRNLWRVSKTSVDRSGLSGSRWESNRLTAEGWEVTGGDSGTGAYSFIYTASAYRVPVESDKPYSWAIPLKNTGSVPFPVSITTWLERTTSGNVSKSAKFTLQPGESRVALLENLSADNAKDIRFSLYYHADDERVPEGAKITLLDGISLVQGSTSPGPVNGDSSFWGWAGAPGDSESIEYVKESTYQSPFLPIVLASSTVQGEITLDIGGDAPAYPTWVVDGPGTDLIIENDEGEHLKVLTEFSEQVTITTDPLMQDIVSPNNPNGELWEFVPTNSKFFPLKPGKNRLKVSMVGAKPNSRVRLLYRETYKAGW